MGNVGAAVGKSRGPRRTLWFDGTARRQGWVARHATIGGGFRALELPPTLARSLSMVFIARSDLPSYRPVDEDTLRVVGIVRKLLQRGGLPPAHPQIERRLLEGFGLAVHGSGLPGDLTPRLAAGDAKWLSQRAGTVLADGPAEADAGLVYDSDAERAFHRDWVPAQLGEEASRWIVPQASLDALLFASGVDSVDPSGQRRVDFLAAPPWGKAFVIEIDGPQHDSKADAKRKGELLRAGYEVVRVTTSELEAGSGPGLAEIAGRWRERPAGDAAVTALLAAPAQLHRFVAALLEAVEAGFLAGDRWAVELWDDLGVVVEHAELLLALIAAVDDLWGQTVAPEVVELSGPEGSQTVRFERDGLAYRRGAVVSGSELDVRVRLEATRTPVEPLPVDADLPEVVVRPAPLPVGVATPMSGVAKRAPVKTDGAHTLEALTTILQTVFAKEAFREGQHEALLEVLEGRDCVVLLPTGGGKSLIYQMAGLIQPGLTLVIDPIVSLMDDQVRGLDAHGITRVAAISAYQVAAGLGEKLLSEIASGEAQFAFVAPERLQQQRFREALTELSFKVPVNLAVVDEAHCVSEWGHDFRTAYLNLGPVLRRVCKDPAGAPPALLALTGTASRAVLRDVLFELDIDRGASPHTLIRPATFDRAELVFSIVRAEPSSAEASLRGFLQGLPARFGRPPQDFFSTRGDATHSGLVFCPHVNGARGTWEVAKRLAPVVGHHPLTYAGGKPKSFGGNKDDWEHAKREHAERFVANDSPVLVATKSFGMGIDKPNIRWVVHYGIPGSIEAYYQEAGRAGRDGQHAECAIVLTEFDEARARRLLDEDADLAAARVEHEAIGYNDADDISRALWFHFNSFHGIDDELAHIAELLDVIGDLDKPRTLNVPFSGKEKDPAQERAIHRLVVLGVVTEYLVEFGRGFFVLRLTGAASDAVVHALLQFVGRSQPSRVPVIRRHLDEREWDKPREAVLDCAGELITFVYDTIERSRRRSLREIWLAARAGDGEELRRRILDYLTEGDVAPLLEELLDKPSFSFDDWLEALDEVALPEEAGEWRGNTARLLASEPDHPGLLLARAYSELLAPDGSLAELEANLASAITSAKERYDEGDEAIAALLSWLAERVLANRSAALATLWHVAERHGHSILRPTVEPLLASEAPDPDLATVHLDLALAETLEAIDELATDYTLERWHT